MMPRTHIAMQGLVLLLSLVLSPCAGALTYHVSTGGHDSNSCAAAANVTTPRRTIQSAIGCLSAGDTLLIHAGTYDESLSSGAVRYPAGTGWEQPVTIAGAH